MVCHALLAGFHTRCILMSWLISATLVWLAPVYAHADGKQRFAEHMERHD